jgi:periplasmic protein CpxP/Spy
MFWFRRSIPFLMLVVSSGVTLATASAQDQVPQLNYGSFNQSPAANQPAPNNDRLVGELNLTPSQVQQLKAIKQKFYGQKQQQQQLLTAAKKDLSNAIASNASADQIHAQRDRVKSIQQRLSDLRFSHMMATKKVLTSEQWVKLQKLKKQQPKNSNS